MTKTYHSELDCIRSMKAALKHKASTTHRRTLNARIARAYENLVGQLTYTGTTGGRAITHVKEASYLTEAGLARVRAKQPKRALFDFERALAAYSSNPSHASRTFTESKLVSIRRRISRLKHLLKNP